MFTAKNGTLGRDFILLGKKPEDGVHLLPDQLLHVGVGGAGVVLGVDVVRKLAQLKQFPENGGAGLKNLVLCSL
jgi:hypothetical protein